MHAPQLHYNQSQQWVQFVSRVVYRKRKHCRQAAAKVSWPTCKYTTDPGSGTPGTCGHIIAPTTVCQAGNDLCDPSVSVFSYAPVDKNYYALYGRGYFNQYDDVRRRGGERPQVIPVCSIESAVQHMHDHHPQVDLNTTVAPPSRAQPPSRQHKAGSYHQLSSNERCASGHTRLMQWSVDSVYASTLEYSGRRTYCKPDEAVMQQPLLPCADTPRRLEARPPVRHTQGAGKFMTKANPMETLHFSTYAAHSVADQELPTTLQAMLSWQSGLSVQQPNTAVRPPTIEIGQLSRPAAAGRGGAAGSERHHERAELWDSPGHGFQVACRVEG